MRIALVGHGLPYRVEATADLAILQFAKFRLWKDLDEHWADFADEPAGRPPGARADRGVRGPGARHRRLRRPRRAGRRSCPVPADASQLRAIAEADAGRTFVLEGPPGTGKSQTITNLLTRAVADGKRVLFVAEKRAALDVVARRLDAVGMGPFALDLHDKGSRASMVRAQVGLALEHAVAGRRAGPGRRRGDAALGPADAGPLRRPAAQPNAVGLSLYSARTSELAAGTEVRAAAGARPIRGQRAGRDADRGAGARWRCCPTSPT